MKINQKNNNNNNIHKTKAKKQHQVERWKIHNRI